MEIKTAVFVKSFADAAGLTDIPDLPEIALAGASNVGKSSFINKLCGVNKLCKTSSDPGRTRLVNRFLINGSFYFTDLPGYGFSRAPKEQQLKYNALMDEYFNRIKPLRVFLLTDIRREPSERDLLMADFLYKKMLPFTIIANKSDKLSGARRAAAAIAVSRAFKVGADNIITFSALTGDGKDKVLKVLEVIL